MAQYEKLINLSLLNQFLTKAKTIFAPKITASGILKGDGQGGVSAATAGTDYGTYSKPSTGIPKTDLASDVQSSLSKADTALQQHQSLAAYRTEAAQDDIDAAQNAQIAARAKADEIGIVITGKRPAVAVTAGQYVIVRSSKISGVTDGLYIAVNTLSPSTDVTAANLRAVNRGGLNGLQDSFNSRFIPGVLSDLNTLGESAHALLFAEFNINTAHTPYAEGVTGATAGTVFHTSVSANYSCQIAMAAGVSSIFIRYKATGRWSTWSKITST